ncbi:MAG: PEP-CTERM sorting domain-containing protein [Planctomycetota bacterium]
MKRFLVVPAILVGLMLSTPTAASAQSLPPELVDLFEQLGIELDESGQPVPPPPAAEPAPPSPPPTDLSTPEGQQELADLIGIPVEVLFPPTPPAPVDPPAPVEPPTPVAPSPPAVSPEPIDLTTDVGKQAFADMLGVPLELLFPTTVPAPPEPTPPTGSSPLPDLTTPEGLAEFLGLPVETLLGEHIAEPTTVFPPPEGAQTPDEFLAEALGVDVFNSMMTNSTQFAAAVSSMTFAVPEPTSAFLTLAAAWAALGRRRT